MRTDFACALNLGAMPADQSPQDSPTEPTPASQETSMFKYSAFSGLTAAALIGFAVASTGALAAPGDGVKAIGKAKMSGSLSAPVSKSSPLTTPGPVVKNPKFTPKITLPSPPGSPVPGKKKPPIWVKYKPIKIVKPIHVVHPVVVGATAAAVSYPAAAYRAAPSQCRCLTKEYLPNGAVLFKDNCTNEYAANPPLEQTAQAPTQ
jgi:hypothetical protein